MRARVRDIREGTRAAAGGHEDVFVGFMCENAGEIIEVRPDRLFPEWFEDEHGFSYHADWLDFDTVSDKEG